MKTLKTTFPRLESLPLISISMGLCATLLFQLKGLSEVFQYDRLAIADGELWRSVTGHFTHWSFDHFLWDTIVFVALGAVCEHFCRRGYLTTLLAAALCIPAATWVLDPGMEIYRGLSGLGSSLFVFAIVMVARTKYRKKEWPGFAFSVAAGLFLAGKIIYEYTSKLTLFVDSNELFSPAPLAHLVGAAVGLATAIYFMREGNDVTAT